MHTSLCINVCMFVRVCECVYIYINMHYLQDEKGTQKNYFYRECILGKIIHISYIRVVSTLHYLKIPLYVYMGCHLYQPNSHENGISFN